jgi:hypothetical protein
LYWRARSDQTADPALAARFAPIAEALEANEDRIAAELRAAQGSPQDIGGYRPDPDQAAAAMRPSPTLNAVLDGIWRRRATQTAEAPRVLPFGRTCRRPLRRPAPRTRVDALDRRGADTYFA